MATKDLQIIGRVAKLSVNDGDFPYILAKVDTGADSSSIWASDIKLGDDGTLSFSLFGPGHKYYSGKQISTNDFTTVTVANSFGHKEIRYRVSLPVEIDGRKVRATFTLANRSLKSYPALIGRRLLNKKFLVDVSLVNGKPSILSGGSTK
jgi:hypothetical protein